MNLSAAAAPCFVHARVLRLLYVVASVAPFANIFTELFSDKEAAPYRSGGEVRLFILAPPRARVRTQSTFETADCFSHPVSSFPFYIGDDRIRFLGLRQGAHLAPERWLRTRTGCRRWRAD